MEALLESLVTVQRRLRGAGIESVAIGGLAVAAWGEVRMTRDVDLRVLLGRQDAERLLQALGPEYVPFAVDLPPVEALRKLGMLFVRDPLGTRIDLLVSDLDFDRDAVRRGQNVEIAPGCTVRVCTAEDLLIYKILAGRPQDLVDVSGIVAKQGADLDVNRVRDWLTHFEQMIDDSTLVATFERFLRRCASSPVDPDQSLTGP